MQITWEGDLYNAPELSVNIQFFNITSDNEKMSALYKIKIM